MFHPSSGNDTRLIRASQLHKLSRAARKLGSSAGVLAASTRVEYSLWMVVTLFHKHALKFYPEVDTGAPLPISSEHQWQIKSRLLSSRARREPRDLSFEFKQFADNMEHLCFCFVRLPQLAGELPDRSLITELRVRVS